MNEYKPRIVDSIVNQKLRSIGAMLIQGPKWCGKTTTAIQFSKSVIRMDNPAKIKQNLTIAELDPQRLLEGDTPRVIDEWQIAPNLWDTVRYEVDQRDNPGQFILTGSAVPAKTDNIFHSGTGRFSWITMRPMSLYESGESTGSVSLEQLFDENFNSSRLLGENSLTIEDICYLACRGGWPKAITLDKEDALSLPFDYFNGVVNSDINRADGVQKDPERVKRLMKSYARNQGSQISINDIINDIKTNDNSDISYLTISNYLSALKNIFVIEDMPAWNPNLRSKIAIRTVDTRYFVDPSIATASLGIGPNDLINDLQTLGFIFETMCVRDLRVYAQYLNGDVYHYRDSSNLECDTVIHLRNGKYGLIEIKLGGESLIESGAKNLIKLSNKLDTTKMKKPSFLMILVGVGDIPYKREDGVLVVPLGCLKY